MSGRPLFFVAMGISALGLVLVATGLVQQPTDLGIAFAGLAVMGIAYVLALLSRRQP